MSYCVVVVAWVTVWVTLPLKLDILPKVRIPIDFAPRKKRCCVN